MILRTRNLILNNLLSNGWEGNKSNELFDQGWWIECEVITYFTNSWIELILQVSYEDRKVFFTLKDIQQGKFTLHFFI